MHFQLCCRPVRRWLRFSPVSEAKLYLPSLSAGRKDADVGEVMMNLFKIVSKSVVSMIHALI